MNASEERYHAGEAVEQGLVVPFQGMKANEEISQAEIKLF
jgi:hypothetical protein